MLEYLQYSYIVFCFRMIWIISSYIRECVWEEGAKENV
jgi:hypothetical protein